MIKKRFAEVMDFFAFTRSERRGIIVLLGIFVFFVIGIQVIPYCYPNPSKIKLLDDSQDPFSSHKASEYTPRNAHPHKRPADTATPKSYRPFREKKAFTVQANICDTLDLQEIRGIGSVFSKRIIKYRDLLGGFVRKEQLLEVWGIDSAKYVQIEKAFIIDQQHVRKINLNTATINDLKNHPYLDYYQAKAIVQTRDKQGLYKDISDILKIALVDSETFDLIKDYLEL